MDFRKIHTVIFENPITNVLQIKKSTFRFASNSKAKIFSRVLN